MNEVLPPKASIAAHNANAFPRVVAAQPSTMTARRLGSRPSSMRCPTTSCSRGRTDVASHFRSLGTRRKVPIRPSSRPATRYSTLTLGTKRERLADTPAAVLKKISSRTCVITCTDCCNATAVVARIGVRPPFCRYLALSARPPTPAGVVVAANLLATCMTIRPHSLTTPSAAAHSADAAPRYVSPDAAGPSSANHQFAARNPAPPVRAELLNG